MTEIQLRGAAGAVALVDDSDFALVAGAWYLHDSGYAVRPASGGAPTIYMHRLILGLAPGDGMHADHINCNPLDNRRSNLRAVTCAVNAQNRAQRSFGTSRFRGVYFHRGRGRWLARVMLNYRHHYLGYFDDEVEAAKVAEAYRREHMPFAAPDAELARVLAISADATAAIAGSAAA